MALADRISVLKKERGMTNEDLAVASGVPKSTVDKITSGITTNPSLDTVRAFAIAMKCRLDDFDDIPPPTKKDAPSDNRTLKVANQFYKLDEHGKVAVESIAEVETARMEEMAIEKEPLPFPVATDEELRELLFGAEGREKASEEDILEALVTLKEHQRKRREEEGK